MLRLKGAPRLSWCQHPLGQQGQCQHCPERLLCHSSAHGAIPQCRQNEREPQDGLQPCEKGLRDLSRLCWQPLHTQQEARRSQSQVIHSGAWWEKKGQQTEFEIGKVQVRNNGKPLCHEVSSSSGRGCTERLCSLHAWRLSWPNWTKPWASWSQLAQLWAGGWTRCLPKSFHSEGWTYHYAVLLTTAA